MAWGARNLISTLTGTIEMFGFDCAARMTRRPIRPNPLIPTRIDILLCLRVDSVLCGLCGCAVFGGGGGVSGDLYLEPPAHGLPLQLGSAAVRSRADAVARPASARAGANTRPSPRGNFELARHGATRQSAAVALEVMQISTRRATDSAKDTAARGGCVRVCV